MITFPHTPLALLFLQAPAAGPGSFAPLVIQFGLIIAIIYFIMIRPQQRQRKKHEDLLSQLKRGDEVVTSGGIVGKVIHIKELSSEAGKTKADDQVTIESGGSNGSRLVVERGRIARINGSAPSTPAPKPGAATE
jgi:preprotein translocase subunit YajC